MSIYYPKLRNKAHAMCLSISIAIKGNNFYISIIYLTLWHDFISLK